MRDQLIYFLFDRCRTGYEDSRSTLQEIFGVDVSERVCAKVYGVDSEGEGRGTYRPTGHPGLWFAMGDFMKARSTSKQLVSIFRVFLFITQRSLTL